MQDNSNSVRNLVIGMLLVAAPFGVGYLLTRGKPTSEVLLIIAVFCAGLALTFAAASGLQWVGGVALRLSGRSRPDIAIAGLAALSLLTPWTIEIAVGNVPQIFGWTNPLALVTAFALLLSVTSGARRSHGLALAIAGLALMAWLGWASWLLTTRPFTSLRFSFVPVDILSTGWYAGLIAFAIAVDGFAVRRARDPQPASWKEVWALALAPGMGLVRLGLTARGRGWLIACALIVAFIGITAVNDGEFAYWGHYNLPPPDRGRWDTTAGAAVLALVLAASWLDTWRTLRRRVMMSDWLSRVAARSRGETR
jgi:hypothetical protein